MGTSEHERATAAGYDRWAATYDDTDPSTWLDEPFLLKHLDPFPGCRILDVGCGTGRYLRLLAASRYRIVGIDLSRRMLERAKHRLGSRSDIWVLQASAATLPFKPCSFDRIMSGLVIDHVSSAEQWFRQISGMLPTDGRAVVAAVHPQMQRLTGWNIEIRNGAEEAIRIPGHLHEVASLVAAARDAGLAVVAMEEPRVTDAMLEHRPAWSGKIGLCALLLMALKKR